MVKISIDTESCCGVGYCARIAPEIFAVVDDKATLREDADVASADPKLIKRAAAACPWRAIQVED